MLISEFAAAMGSRVEGLTRDFEIKALTTLEDAGPDDVSFVSNEKYTSHARDTRAGAVIVPAGMQIEGVATVPLTEPWTGVLYLLGQLHPAAPYKYFSGIHPSAVVDPTASVAASASVGPNAVIGPRTVVGERSVIGPCCVIGPDVVVGDDCVFHALVSVTHGNIIGSRVILHAGASIGADGFKYEPMCNMWTKIPQVGRVVLEDDVEIGANACIDRASFTETRIGANTKIDNLVMVAHNARVGRNTIIVSQTGIAGSSTVGDNAILAAQVGVADNIKLGNNIRILARSGIKDDVADGEILLGTPGRPVRLQARIVAAEGRLPELVMELARLRKRVEQLEKTVSGS